MKTQMFEWNVQQTHQVRDVGDIVDVRQRFGMIVLIANYGRFVDVVAIDVDNVGRMLDDFLGKVGVCTFVYDFPFVGAGVEDLKFVSLNGVDS